MKINVNAVSSEINPEPCEPMAGVPCGYVIFGASGDLTLRKLLPAVFSLFRKQKIGDRFFVVGFARSLMTDNEFKSKVVESIRHAYGEIPQSEIDDFVIRCFYVAGAYDQDDGYIALHEKTAELDKKFATEGNLVLHIATPPLLYAVIVSFMGKNGLVTRHQNEQPFHRVIVEKPFGHDLESAVNLNKKLLEYLADDQIYRIDHYLGKETVQNILMFRFANQIFEPAWNRHYIDHVQITVSEQLGVEHRAGYFEQTGLLRDMFQNHMLQLAFRTAIHRAQYGWRRVAAKAMEIGIPMPAIVAGLTYYDGYRSARLPANLLQAQRDYFGSHTYERIDKPRGDFFHTDWTGHGGKVSSQTYTL